MTIELEPSFCSLIEDFLVKVFREFNSQIDTDYEIKVYNGRQSGNFINEVGNTAVFNLYTESNARNKAYSNGSRIDTTTFFIDIFVAPKRSTEKIKAEYQDEAAHKFLLYYTHYADRLLSNLSNRRFGFKEPLITNYRFVESRSFENQYSGAEIICLGSRLVFTLNIPFVAVESAEYKELAEIIIHMKPADIKQIFKYNKE